MKKLKNTWSNRFVFNLTKGVGIDVFTCAERTARSGAVELVRAGKRVGISVEIRKKSNDHYVVTALNTVDKRKFAIED